MEGLRTTLPFLLLLALVHHTIALKCNAGCVGNSGNVFKYQPGTVYKYELDGNSVMGLAGAEGDVTKMVVKASADVAALPNCAFSISLTNFQVLDKAGKAYAGDKGKPVVFSMNNGVVTSDICSAKDEPIEALNVKRAIISLLQSSSDSISKSEIDIFGTCPTDTSVHKSGAKLKVKKIRNLSNCAHRQNLMIPFTTTHYHSSSDVQSIPWISAQQKIEQDVEGQVKYAMSKEEYTLPPPGSAEAGATVTVTTKLSLKGTGGGAAPPAGIEKEKTIILEAMEPHGENLVKNAGSILKKICEGAQGEIDKDNADRYSYLTYLLSRSNKATMNQLYNQAKAGQICADKETAKKILFDSVFDSQTADGVQFMSELLKNKEVTGLKAKIWYASLGNVRHATIPSIKSAAAMLDDSSPLEAYLGAGSLLGRYCRTHNCENVPEVNQLQKKISTPLGKGCKAASLADEDKLLASIKGLGNSGYLSGGVTKQLIQCATDHSARSRVRAASLDALRADPNKENVKKTAISLLKDKNEDSEIRIKAYLIIVECPCGKMAGVIKDVLDKEESFQVGNFIVSHLRNIRASKNPDKAKAKAHFSAIMAPKSFPFDIRKYSTNAETSSMLDSLNLGGSAESNVIYSQKSWIPRTVTLNLTSHLFGSSFNLVELDIRTENLERMLERLAGPKGYLMGDPDAISTDVNQFWNKFVERAKQTFRPKRAVSQNDIDGFAKQVKLGADWAEHDESLDLSLKMFGSEVAWIPLHGAHLDKSPSDNVENAFSILDTILEKAKNLDIDYTKHKVLGEAVIGYPTAIGVPLKLKGESAVAFRVKLDGNLDVPAILRDPKNALVKFQLIPSGSHTASFIAKMEAAGLNTGFKVSATSHSSTGTDVTVRLLGGQGIDVKIGLPIPKQDFFSFNTKIISFADSAQDRSMTPVNFNVKREEYSGCFDQISDMVGLTFCGEVSAPWDGPRMISPAYGPISLSARIEKEDPSLTNFHFKAFYNIQKEDPQHKLEIVLDTPNSKKERRIGVVIENTVNPNLGLKARIDSPFGNIKLDSSAINTAAEKSVNAELVFLDQEYIFKAGVKQASADTYKPFLEYKAPDGPKSRFSALQSAKQGGQQVSVSGDIKVSGKKMIFNGVKVSVSRQDYVLDGSAWDEDKTSGVDLKVTYAEDVLTIKANRDQVSPHEVKRTLQVASQKYPDVSISASWDFLLNPNKKSPTLKSDIIVVHGPDPNSETARVTVSNHFSAQNDPKGHLIKLDAKNLVSYPIVNLKGKLNFHGDSHNFGYDVEGSFETYNGGSSLNVVLGPEYSIDMTGKVMDNSVIFHSKRNNAGEDKSKFTNSLELNPGGKYQLNALVTHKLQPDDIDAHVEAKIILPSDPKTIDVKAGVTDNKDLHSGLININAGGKNLVDGKVSITKGKDLGGDFKLVLPEYVDSNGQFKFGGSGLDGHAQINLLKAKKKIEGKTHFVINMPSVKGTADLCLDSKCIKLSTDTSIVKETYETKNKLELPAGLVINLNAKGDEPKGSHFAEAELQGPDGRHTKVHYDSKRHMRPGDTDVEYIASIEDLSKAGAKPRRIEAKLVGKHIDLEKETGDGQVIVTYQTPEGKDFSLHTNFKRAPGADNKWVHNAEIGATGSLVQSPLTLKFESEADEKYFEGEFIDDDTGEVPPTNYHLTLSLGNELSIESQGKASGHSMSNELNINMPNQKEGIKNFKWSTNNFVDLLADNAKFKTSNTIKWDNKFVKTNVEVNEEDNGVNFNADFEGDSIPKRTISGNGHFNDNDDKPCKLDGAVAMTWENKKVDLSYEAEFDEDIASLHLKGTLPDGKKFDVNSKGKYTQKSDNEKSLHGETTALIGGKKWVNTGTIEYSPEAYNINFMMDQPEGKSQLKSKFLIKSNRHFASEYALKWVSNGGGSWVGDSDVNWENENSFSIVANADSPKMNLNKFHFAAKVTPDKKLEMDIQNNGKVVASAKSSYQYKTEGTKRIIDGSGTMTIDGKDYPLSYDASFDTVNSLGAVFQSEVNAKAGDRSFKFQSSGKPNDFHMKRTYCKAAGDCSDAEFVYKNEMSGLDSTQTLKYKLDLSMFNPKLSDLKINSEIKREGLIYDQDFDFEWGESKVKYNAFIHSDKAGASLTLPSRTLATETTYTLPKKDKNAIKFEGNVWLDKTKSPKDKAYFLLSGEAGKKNDLYTISGEAKFNSPALPKPLIIKGDGSVSSTYTNPKAEGSFVVDIFKKPQMKIAGDWKVIGKNTDNGYDYVQVANLKSEGLKLNVNFNRHVVASKESLAWTDKLKYTNVKGEVKEGTAKFEANLKRIHLAIKTPEITFIDYLAKWEASESSLKVKQTLDMTGLTYIEDFDVKLQPHLEANYKFVNNKGCEKSLTGHAIFDMGKMTKLDLGFDGKSFLVGEVSLAEANFLKPQVHYDKDAVASIRDCFQKSSKYVSDHLEEVISKYQPRFQNELNGRASLFKDAEINFEDVAKYYQGEFEKIQNEILEDNTLQGAVGVIKEALSTFFENAAQIIEEFQSIYSKSFNEITQAVEALTKTVNELVPTVRKSFEDLTKAAANLADDLIKMCVDISDLILKEIAAHSDDFDAIFKNIADVIEEYGKIFFKHAFQLHKDVQEFFDETVAKLKDLPISDMINEQYENIKALIEASEFSYDDSFVAELTGEILGYLDDLIGQIKGQNTMPELVKFLETLKTWIQKAVIDKEQVNHMDFLKTLGQELFAAFSKLCDLLEMHLSSNEEAFSKTKVPTLAFPLTRIPMGLLRLSGLDWIGSKDLPDLIQVFATYLPAMNPDDWMPPFTARSYLLGGSEIITFDGSHLTVGGDCSYVLTQDYLDGNFSVIGTFKGGKLQAIQVSDGTDIVELRHAKKPLVNGKESEFPIFQGQIVAWKRAAVVGVKTKSGLKILCTPDCLRCKIRVDGIYFGRLRGLLGTYNYEQYDELTLPSGEVADSAEKFLGAWAIGGACAPQSPKAPKREATCTKTFTDAVDFMACYHLVSPKPYREACDRLASLETTPEGLQKAVCNVAFAYSLQCQTRIPTAVPSSCLKCAKTNKNIFEKEAEIKPPFKKADVVFTVERLEKNKEVFESLIKPLIANIKADLAGKGISDVKFGLVGFGGNKRMWPAYYTKNGKILSDDLESSNLEFESLPAKRTVSELFEDASAESGVTGKSMTYLDLVEYYPWRMGSSKVVVGVHATPCKESHAFYMLQHMYFIGSYMNKGITFHTVSPVKNLKLTGGSTKNIIAIANDEVFKTEDAGKKELDGHGDKTADDNLKYDNDVCFTFAHMTGGYVFPSENYLSGGSGEKDAFKKILTTSIVETLTDVDDQHDMTCTCHPKANPYDGIFSQPDCRIINI